MQGQYHEMNFDNIYNFLIPPSTSLQTFNFDWITEINSKLPCFLEIPDNCEAGLFIMNGTDVASEPLQSQTV